MKSTDSTLNILIYHYDETAPMRGGIGRTTYMIATELRNRYGYKLFNLNDYHEKYPESDIKFKYDDCRSYDRHITAEDVAKAINDWEIDIILQQETFDKNTVIRKGIELSGRECKLIYFHHSAPKYLTNFPFRVELHSFLTSHEWKIKLRGLLKMATFPVYSRIKPVVELRVLRKKYNDIIKNSDRVCLLSKSFFKEWAEVSGISDTSYLRAIPNMLSFDSFATPEQISAKKKKALIVSRLWEYPKNLTCALDIWKQVCDTPGLQEWELDVVGDGDLPFYLDYVKRHHIPRINFLGTCDSESFYEQSAIFLMTSTREGWPMTLMESAQKGCIPVAFGSFASVTDIITDGENGYIIPPYNKKLYAQRLKNLMLDRELREKMALRCVEMSQRFTKDSIMPEWESLINSL